MSRQSLWALCAVLSGFAFGAIAPAPVSAQDQPIPDLLAVDAQVNREQVGQSDSESIDPLTGVLTLSYADVHLPGNGGFDLKVVRTYRSDRVFVPGLLTLAPFWAQERLAGDGWTVHFGRVLRRMTDVCTNGPSVDTYDGSLPTSGSQSFSGVYATENPVLELPDGSVQQLIFSTTGSPLYLTPQRWRADCQGDGLVVYSPDGVRYDMTQKVVMTGIGLTNSWYATKITDRNGNFALISYAGAGSPEVANVTTNDGRSVYFTYFDAGQRTRRVATISTTGRTWTYGYDAQVDGTNVRYLLKSVNRPDVPSTAWKYTYAQATTPAQCNPNQPGGANQVYAAYNTPLASVTNPFGPAAAVAYGYGCWMRAAGNSPSHAIGILSKATSDGYQQTFRSSLNLPLPNGITSEPFAQIQKIYSSTFVSTSAGQLTEYRFGGVSVNSSVLPAWSVGLLMAKIIYAAGPPNSTYTWQRPVVQTEGYSWAAQKIGNESTLTWLTAAPASPGSSGVYELYLGPTPHKQTGIFAPVRSGYTVVRDGATYQTTYSNHDAYGNPQTITESGPNGGARTTNLAYYIDPVKWIVRQVDDETTVGVGSVVRGWDASGNLLSENRDGVTTSYTRYATGDIWTETRPRGLVTTYSLYKRGIAQSEAQPEGVNISRIVSDAGNVTSVTNGEGQTTTFVYEPLDRLARIIPPVGNLTTIAYTANTKTATRGSLQQIETVDGFGRTISVTTGGISVKTTYDGLGRKTFASIVGFPTVGHVFTYDELDRVKRITHNADASYREFTYGPATLAVRDERGYVTTHTYRAYGNPDQQLLMSIAAPVAAANVTITRNGRGQVTSATQGGVPRSFGYDTRYFLTSTTNPEVGTTTYGRDAAGNMTTKQVTAGPLGASGTTTYDYDNRNRLWRVTYPNASPSTVTNTYWRTDKLKTANNAAATRSYGYDANQNLKTETVVVDGLTLAATYNYTTNDQLTSIVYPVLNRTVSFDPDVLGRPRSVTTPTGSMLGVGFWPNGQIADIAFAGGSRVTYGQNTREWLNAVTVKTGDGISRIASTLTHDVAGNLIGVSDSVDASYNRTLTHDGINRLVTAYGAWGTGGFGYDGNGNISYATLNNSNRVYTYDSTRNRLSSTRVDVAGVPQAGTSVAYDHDVYGNAMPRSAGYVYDQTNNLKTAAGRTYAYDATNKRVKTVANGITTYEFRSAQGLLLAEWKKQAGTFDTLKEHIHVAGKEVAEQQTLFSGTNIQPVGWMFLQHDASGSVLSATWSGGGLLFKENYQPYGSQINGTAPGYTQRAFAGHKQDAQDLVYMGARYYNPQIGRFLSVDPKEADPSDLHSLSRYAYANNNPYRYVDPDGREPHPIVNQLFPRGDIFRTAGEALGANAAFIVGAMRGDQALKDAAIDGMRENVSGSDAVTAATMLLGGRSGTGKGGPNFDAARQTAFEKAGLTDPSKVQFSKIDPVTGTVVEFKGPGGAKVGYDGPHQSQGPHHDRQHISWQAAGKRTSGGRERGNEPYSGSQHPSRPDRKERSEGGND